MADQKDDQKGSDLKKSDVKKKVGEMKAMIDELKKRRPQGAKRPSTGSTGGSTDDSAADGAATSGGNSGIPPPTGGRRRTSPPPSGGDGQPPTGRRTTHGWLNRLQSFLQSFVERPIAWMLFIIGCLVALILIILIYVVIPAAIVAALAYGGYRLHAMYWDSRFVHWTNDRNTFCWLVEHGLYLGIVAFAYFNIAVPVYKKYWAKVSEIYGNITKTMKTTFFSKDWWSDKDWSKSPAFFVETNAAAFVMRWGAITRIVIGKTLRSPGRILEPQASNPRHRVRTHSRSLFSKIPFVERVREVSQKTIQVAEKRLRELLCAGFGFEGLETVADKKDKDVLPNLPSVGPQATMIVTLQYKAYDLERLARLGDAIFATAGSLSALGEYIITQFVQPCAQATMTSMLISDLKGLWGKVFNQCTVTQVQAAKARVFEDYRKAWIQIIRWTGFMSDMDPENVFDTVLSVQENKDFYEAAKKHARRYQYEVPPVKGHDLHDGEFSTAKVAEIPLCRGTYASDYWRWLGTYGHCFGLMPDLTHIFVHPELQDGEMVYHAVYRENWLHVLRLQAAITRSRRDQDLKPFRIKSFDDLDFPSEPHTRILDAFYNKLHETAPDSVMNRAWQVGIILSDLAIPDIDPETSVKDALALLGVAQLTFAQEKFILSQRIVSARGDALKIRVQLMTLSGMTDKQFEDFWRSLGAKTQFYILEVYQKYRSLEVVGGKDGRAHTVLAELGSTLKGLAEAFNERAA